jgi:16S rRNA (adenine1518-N6/adenine1519-N6)-dimethyltransferase
LTPAWAEKVVEAIAPSPEDRFLEIGPGEGALTLRLAPRVAQLTAVEIDRDLATALGPRLPPNAAVVTADVLEFDLAPLVAVGPVRVAGNLPYNLSSPILFKLLAAARGIGGTYKKRGQSPFFAKKGDSLPPLRDAVLMLQRVVADRLVAKPGTKDYGVLTIFTGIQADVQRLLTLPPGAFRPPPQVHSAVVRLTFRPAAVQSELFEVFEAMVRTMFTQRRKTILNALRPFAASIEQTADAALADARIDPARRPETLDLSELVRLATVLNR